MNSLTNTLTPVKYPFSVQGRVIQKTESAWSDTDLPDDSDVYEYTHQQEVELQLSATDKKGQSRITDGGGASEINARWDSNDNVSIEIRDRDPHEYNLKLKSDGQALKVINKGEVVEQSAVLIPMTLDSNASKALEKINHKHSDVEQVSLSSKDGGWVLSVGSEDSLSDYMISGAGKIEAS